jgi:hypothetical protein
MVAMQDKACGGLRAGLLRRGTDLLGIRAQELTPFSDTIASGYEIGRDETLHG